MEMFHFNYFLMQMAILGPEFDPSDLQMSVQASVRLLDNIFCVR